MTIRKCKCGALVTGDVKYCPGCGEIIRKINLSFGRIFLGIIVFIVLSIFLKDLIRLPQRPTKIQPKYNLSYVDIYNKTRAMTTAQRKQFFREIKYSLLTDNGYVLDVKKRGLNNYDLYVGNMPSLLKIGPPDVTIKRQPEKSAMSFKKNDHIKYSGTIVSVKDLLGAFPEITLIDATVKPVPKNKDRDKKRPR